MGPADLSRLEEHVLGLLGEGAELRLADLRRDFPEVEEADIQRVQTSAEILHAWLGDLGGPAQAPDRPSRESWLAPGERIGGYVVLRRIPGGGMGQVYHAVQESLYPRRVALKVHRLGTDQDRDLRRARREAEVASRLVHPHLAAVHDMGHDEVRGLVYFSMQLVDGRDLREALRRDAERAGRSKAGPDRARVRRIVTRISEVAGALAELHGRGYVHRDVKPENILLRSNAGRDGRSEGAVLVDFGLARAERALRGDGALVAGTPGYIPPEAELGGGVTPAGDVYSLGVVLVEVLRGAPLPRDARGLALRPSPDELSSLRSDGVDPDLAAIVRRATRTDPAARYRDAGELQADLERWLAGDLVSARRPPFHERTWRAARRHPRRTALLLLSLPLLAGIVFAGGLATREAQGVRRGLAAIERGEPARGWDELVAAGPLFVRSLVRGRPDLERDLLQDTEDAPVTRVVRAEHERGRAAALELAAAFLERDGFETAGVPNHPDLEAFLLHDLSAAAHPEERSQALRVAARLFYERPVGSPGAAAWAAPFRERLREVVADPATEREDLLHAVSALGGCGTLAELDLLLTHAEASVGARDVEAARLANYSSERILRGCVPTGSTDALASAEWAVLEQRYAALWRDQRGLFVLSENAAERVTGSWTTFLTAWGVLHRRTGYHLQLREDFEAGLPSDSLLWRAALRGTDDGELQELLLSRAERRSNLPSLVHLRRDELYELGMACAYLGSGELGDALDARLADDSELLDSFRQGRRDGAFEMEHGVATQRLPDDASRLRHLLDEESSLEPLPLDPGAVLPAGEVALWRFDPRVRAGWAADPRVGGGTHWRHGGLDPSHLRLPRSGAWFEAPLIVDEAAESPTRTWNVVLVHLAASRNELPFEGQAWIRVELDDTVLADRHRVGHVGNHELPLQIEADLLTPGEHRLRVTVVEASTTYWIHELRVEKP